MTVSGGGRRRALADALKRLRLSSGLSGEQLAAALGVAQSTVSRIENGRQRVSVAQVHQWCVATNAPPDRLAELLTLAEDVLVGPTSWAAASETGSEDLQPETAAAEQAAGTVCVYQPAGLPGLVQTAAYARRIFESDGPIQDLATRVMHRMERQAVLYDEAKRFRFLIPEAVLRWPFGPAAEQLEQIDRVRTVVDRPNVELGILPLEPNPVWRLQGFVLFDDVPPEVGEPFVTLETLTRPVDITAPDQLERYRRAFGRLAEQAVYGDHARNLLGQIARTYRR
jgi:transcriptional regulator with XRE-family HTH domain